MKQELGQITVGLDFGTHQTKVCVECRKEGQSSYNFFKFKDLNGQNQIILPSVVQMNKDNTLSYGFVNEKLCATGNKQSEPIPPDILELPDEPQNYESDYGKSSCNYLSKRKKEECQELMIQSAERHKKWREECEKAKAIYVNQCVSWQRKYNKWLEEGNNQKLIYRYFKQATFSSYEWPYKMKSDFLSILYLSYILFDLEAVYGTDFSICMGIPSGRKYFNVNKRKAISILSIAYRLVEIVFKNDKIKFMNTQIPELEKILQKESCHSFVDNEYFIRILPEAYAMLKPLTTRNKIEEGMSLMVDIGGGTTDFSFFAIKDGIPQIYDYASIPKGLNHIIDKARPKNEDKLLIQYSLDSDELDQKALVKSIRSYRGNLEMQCFYIYNQLIDAFKKSLKMLDIKRFQNAIENRILIYSGGGSTYKRLRFELNPFVDVHCIDASYWDDTNIENIKELNDLCPILSTSFGLSISPMQGADNDEDILHECEDLFKGIEDSTPHEQPEIQAIYGLGDNR
jgi:hypothetical protein